MLLHAFFVIPVLVAVLGIARLRDPSLRVLVAGLVLMTYATIFVLQVGDQGIGTVPRLVYTCFPAIYLLAALALDRMPRAAPFVLVGAMAVRVTLDLFGHITQDGEFCVGAPPVFLPD